MAAINYNNVAILLKKCEASVTVKYLKNGNISLYRRGRKFGQLDNSRDLLFWACGWLGKDEYFVYPGL